METSYKQHVVRNFTNYLRQFVNQMFKKEHLKLLEKCRESKFQLRSRLKYELKKVKEALLNDTLDCPEQYHGWIRKYRHQVLPKEYLKSYEIDIQKRPERYFVHMIRMSRILQKGGLKSFQPIPLRTETRNKYAVINTNAILDIFPFQNKGKYQAVAGEHAYGLWTMFFNLKPMKVDRRTIKGMIFNNRIETDGLAASVFFMTPEEARLKCERNERRYRAANEARREYAGKSFDEIEQMKSVKRDKKAKTEAERAVQIKEHKAERSRKYRQMKKSEQEKLKTESRLKGEFCYIEDMIKAADHLSDLKKFRRDRRFVYIDPGMRSVGTFMNDEGEFFNYRTRRRLKETKRLKYQRMIQNRKNSTKLETSEGSKSIAELEEELAKLSHKSSFLKDFTAYTKKKFEFRRLLTDEGSYHECLQKLKWHTFINTQRHKDRMLNELESKFGKNAVMVVGDWSGRGRIKHISTPGVGFRRMLSERFRVHLVDEFKTSKVNCYTGDDNANMKMKVNGKIRKMHAILTYTMTHKRTACDRLGCINRDRNAVMNMRTIVHSLIDDGVRPKAFSRKTTQPRQTKAGRPMSTRTRKAIESPVTVSNGSSETRRTSGCS